MRDGRTNEQLKIGLLSQWKLEAEFRKKFQKTDPPKCGHFTAIYETLDQVSEIGNYFLGYFIIFDVFPMYIPM